MPTHRIALACLTPRPDAGDGGPLDLPSFGIRRVQAAVFDVIPGMSWPRGADV